ncbi:MAG: DUF2127 domain-containing protein [Patescibacteria group bacterium]|nr:DUF2127 domain-containing protein [Patescibacteria group bacterium]
MKPDKFEQTVENAYHVSWYIIAYKLLVGVLEFGAGVSIAVFGNQLVSLYGRLIAGELTEEPHDLFITISERIVPNLFTHNTVLLIYLILLGSVKIAGAIGLIYRKNWGVDLLVGLSIVLLPFQLVSFVTHPNIMDAIYILVGVFIVFYLTEFSPKAWISRFVLRITMLRRQL